MRLSTGINKLLGFSGAVLYSLLVLGSVASPIQSAIDTELTGPVPFYKAAAFPSISTTSNHSEHRFNDSIASLVPYEKRGLDCTGLVQNFLCCFTCCLPSSQTGDPRQQLPALADEGVPVCTGDLPTLAELNQVIVNYGAVASKTSVFYTLNDVGNIFDRARCWFDEHSQPDITGADLVSFNSIVDGGYMDAIGASYIELESSGTMPGFDSWRQIDRFQKLLSQAFAEQAQGTVYVFMPMNIEDGTGQSWSGNGLDRNVWRLWEYPALTRNPKVGKIMRLDPGKDADGNWLTPEPTTIWTQGDPATPNEPAGTNWPAEV